jgi:hypothetical protein
MIRRHHTGEIQVMARTAIATLQTAWDCRWSRPAFHVERPAGIKHLEETWVCTRDGQPHAIDPHDCETCPLFEMEPVGVAPAAAQTPTTTVSAPSLVAPRHLTSVGLSILTTPLALPLTLTLWVTAAAIVGFALAGGLPHPE